jgi:TonB family protein
MDERKNHITNTQDFHRYLNGEMTPRERHDFEKRLLEDEFESEALEGLSEFAPDDIQSDLDKIKGDLSERTRKRTAFVYWRAAAAIVLLGVFSFIIFFLVQRNAPYDTLQTKKMPAETPAETTEEPTPEIADSTEKASEPVVAYQYESQEEEKKQQDLTRSNLEERIEGAVVEPATEEDFILDVEVDDDLEVENLPELDELAIIAPEPEVEMAEEIALPEVHESLDAAKKQVGERRAEAAMAVNRSAGKAKNTRTVTGKIVSVEDQEGIPGVNIVLKGAAIGTVSDIEGNYSIDVPDGENEVLVYSYVGYVSEEIAVQNQNSVDVKMEPDVTALSEIVVTGYGTQEKRDVTGAVTTIKMEDQNNYSYLPPMPVGGNSTFREFVKNNLRYPASGLEDEIKGMVKLKFTVGSNGQISNMEVLKSLGEDFDREAIRLVNEGPKWEPAKENGRVVERDVKVKIRFRPPE